MMFTWEDVSVGRVHGRVGEAQVDHDLVGKVAATVQIFLGDKRKVKVGFLCMFAHAKGPHKSTCKANQAIFLGVQQM